MSSLSVSQTYALKRRKKKFHKYIPHNISTQNISFRSRSPAMDCIENATFLPSYHKKTSIAKVESTRELVLYKLPFSVLADLPECLPQIFRTSALQSNPMTTPGQRTKDELTTITSPRRLEAPSEWNEKPQLPLFPTRCPRL